MKNPATPNRPNQALASEAPTLTLAEPQSTLATPTAAKPAEPGQHDAELAQQHQEYLEHRQFFADAQRGARFEGWGSPWPDRMLANLDRLFGPGAPAEPAARCAFGETDACLYALPSLGHPGVPPTGPELARLTFSLCEQNTYPELERSRPPVAATFAQLHRLLTAPDSPLRAATDAVVEMMTEYGCDGQEAFWLPNPQAAAFGLTAPAESGGSAQPSGLGVLHFAVNPEQFIGPVYQAFIRDPFAGIAPPLVVNEWASGCGLTALVVLPSGPESYARKIEDLVVHFNLYGCYPGLECQLWQNQDPARPCGLYWSASTHFRDDLLA